MWPQSLIPQAHGEEIVHIIEERNTLRLQKTQWSNQVHALSEQIKNLQAENARLRALLPKPPLPPANHVYMAPDENVLHLPVVIETLAVMRDHFRRQGTLRQCSHSCCHQYAFEQMCFREGHMAWCRTHGRIITRNYTSCSTKSEDRGDCMPVWWVPRRDWTDIVEQAYREGKIGHKGIQPAVLNALLFSSANAP